VKGYYPLRNLRKFAMDIEQQQSILTSVLYATCVQRQAVKQRQRQPAISREENQDA